MKKRTTLHGLQCVRGIAALLVVWHHVRNFFPADYFPSVFGAWGVDLFFVLSGFIMAYTTSDGRTTAAEFLRSRLVRIAPLYILATLAFVALLIRKQDVDFGLLMLDLLFIPHWSVEHPKAIYPILIPGWTLNYEMFFYLLFAAGLLLSERARMIAMGLVMCFCVMLRHFSQSSSALGIFYSEPMMLEFWFGMLLFLAYKQGIKTGHIPAMLCIVIGVLWVGGWSASAGTLIGDGYARLLVRGVSAAMVIWAVLSLEANRSFSFGLLERIGDASYAIYLSHILVLSVLGRIFNALTSLPGHEAPSFHQAMVLSLIAMIATTVAGWIIHIYVEKPITKRVRQGVTLLFSNRSRLRAI